MTPLKIIRKIGKILRGGAGRKEIFLGTLCGVLIGFNPGLNFTLVLGILITLLLNANVSFVLLGAAVGKALALALSPITFHLGYFIIHSIGMEGMFARLVNAPVTALMDLNVYAMIGALPLALAIGIAGGSALGTAVVRIRTKMLKADQHEIIGKTFGNKFSRFLLRLAFGKSKLSLDEEVVTKSPLLRKSGVIIVVVLLAIGLLLEFLLLDITIRKGIQSSISSVTGAEVNIGKVHFSMGGGKLELADLQVTDPDKPTHNMIRLDSLEVDLSMRDLLRRSYVIHLMAGDTLKRDVLRDKPGKVYTKAEKEEAEEADAPAGEDASLDHYLAKADSWRTFGEKAQDYLKKRQDKARTAQRGEKVSTTKAEAVVDAKKLGYLKASADLVTDRPAWTVRKLEIRNLEPGGDLPPYLLSAVQLSSHPELNGKPTILALTPDGAHEPDAKLLLRFDNPDELHALTANFRNMNLGEMEAAGDSFPVDIRDGKADLHIDGKFSLDALQLPFTLTLHDLKTEVKEGETVMGMDAETATEVFNSIDTLEVEGVLTGSVSSPRVQINYEKLSANIRDALVAAGKKELSKRANAEMDKARAELEERAGEELDKAMQSEEAQELKSKAGDTLKNLF